MHMRHVPKTQGDPFIALREEWGIVLGESGRRLYDEHLAGSYEELGNTVESLKTFILSQDIRKLEVMGNCIPPPQMTVEDLKVPWLLQVQKVTNVAKPSYEQQDLTGGSRQMLLLSLHDGRQRVLAVEFEKQQILRLPTFGDTGSLGCKILLGGRRHKPVYMVNGVVFLTEEVEEAAVGNMTTVTRRRDLAQQHFHWTHLLNTAELSGHPI